MSQCCRHQHQHPERQPQAHSSSPLPTAGAGGEARLSRVRIQQMDCPTEEALIRSRLEGMPGVFALEFNLLQRVLGIQHGPGALEGILQAIRELGFTPQLESDSRPELPEDAPQRNWQLALAGLAALLAEALHFAGRWPEWTVAGLALAAILICGLGTYRKGWVALKNRNLNINALMSIAVTGALLIGEWPEAAMVMVLFVIAERIEARSLERARRAIRGLLALTPERASVQQADGAWRDVALAEVPIGARVRVRPGERIGLDGEVLEGRSSVDQAPITGESLPVEKGVGDLLFAGTINQSGELEYRVTALANDSTLARIIHSVEEAQGAKAPTQRFVDRFARIYTPTVFVLALLVALLPPLFGGAWLDWLYRALVLLVVACPCALVISTPVTIVSGLAAAARHGLLIKGGVYLESGGRLDVLALDKTGTITHGRPAQTDFVLLAGDAALSRAVAASLAARSDHPVSLALACQAEAEAIALLPVRAFAALPGRGCRGEVEGRLYHLGNHRLVEDLGLCSAELEARLEALERQGKSVVLLCAEGQVLALFAVADTLKPTSRAALAELHALGIRSLMLSGDNPHTAESIGRQVGIDETRGNLLPADKLAAIEALQAQGLVVGMVGDGINDAPALARADIGYAMGAAGSDSAIETADVAVMDDDLRKLATFVRLSRATARILRQNIALALGVKGLFLAVAVAGEATLWMAVFADMGVSLLVVFNGLRLLRR
ncbi:heavy metal translocating P-type ATPase [Zestomonas thermotolerans]|uniref:heavy metal translocating P-type ATPase n=1 Tax=Zestomonas thermotolerans TaxID=157784 RepID=UPI00035FE576|nr:heavy metal translocating P-type ATPase [Pseudomonas thermotolerans]